MKPNRTSRKKKPITRLFPFTEREELLMERAKILSVKFMKSYGKGREPYEIDLSHYENCRPTDAPEQAE